MNRLFGTRVSRFCAAYGPVLVLSFFLRWDPHHVTAWFAD